MKTYRFRALLQNSGWLENARVAVDDAGKIASVAAAEGAAAGDEFIDGCALPAFQNAHSHAFQYAMAGLAENQRRAGDDFWSWRETMYGLATSLGPDEMKAVAAMLYAELVRHGYAHVAEFHYVHHDRDGAPYADRAAMGEALVEAAREAGIKITLIPIFYQKGGFGAPPNERQKRFISKTFDDYARLFEATAEVCRRHAHAGVAVGVHSLRGVAAEDVVRAAALAPALPFHIHVAEQLREVEECRAFLGMRPVEWLLANVDLGARFHLVHATHLTAAETVALAKSGAAVVLCPSTEGNLGDGIFPLRAYQAHGGAWSIGTDSHVGLNPLEELRLLDYGQRLVTHRRDTFGARGGAFAIEQSTLAGRRAMNNHETEFFAVGADFDACVIDASAPLASGVALENLASTLVYTADATHFRETFVRGRLLEPDERRLAIRENFARVAGRLRG